ncbi:hypothetical protein AFLA_003751 [Aspergillus flavus NRRL3357]|nr:hypothetical protein AFLA_003751 [Aspergillus flavus NRRL3357]
MPESTRTPDVPDLQIQSTVTHSDIPKPLQADQAYEPGLRRVPDRIPRVVEQLYDVSLVRGLEDPPTSVLGSGDHGIMDELMLSIYEGQGLSPIQPNPALGPPSLDNHPSLSSQLCGLTGDMDPYVLRHYRFDARAEFPFSKLAIRSVQDAEMPVQFLLSKPELSNESKAASSLEALFAEEALPELSQIVAPEIGERLIKLFSRFINRQFPILSEDSLPAPRAASAHLLAAIYLITQPFTTFDDYLCIEFVYSPPSPQVLFKIAWSELNNAISQPTVQSLQAALILLLHPPLNPLLLDSAEKWTLLGMTVSMAQTLGLHLDPTMWNLPSNEVRTRRRLSWAVFALDKWLAFSFGRPSHISKDNWLITELDSSDVEPGDTTSGTTYSYAIEFSRLTTILDKVLTSLYSLRSLFTKSPTVKPMRTWPVWWQSRPGMLHLCSKSQHNVGISSMICSQVEAAIGDLLTALQIISEDAGISVADLIDDVVFPDMDIDLLLSLVIVSRFREELGLDSF